MRIKTVTVLPATPDKLMKLNELAHDLYFSWNNDVIELFRKLHPDYWIESGRNPVRMLYMLPQCDLDKAAEDSLYISELEAIYDRYQEYLTGSTWYSRLYGEFSSPKIAYFSCEFALHESLPIYSGGLGVLAGDHIKSASDLGLPLVGVGLMYRYGYFHQHLNAEGHQQELFPENDQNSMPMNLMKDAKGLPLQGEINLAGEKVYFNIWKVRSGRAVIYLLDTNIKKNSPHQRAITNNLYDSDRDVRFRQEFLLGVGGVKALDILGIKPEVYHINEGHSAFLLLERLNLMMKSCKLTLEEAKNLVWSTTTFTTHTPVPAGNERFSIDIITKYFKDYIKSLGMSWEDFLSYGRENPFNTEEEFCLTVLALKFSARANGVSKLHGEVSRKMWQNLYHDIPESEVPISHITNGVHATTWMSLTLKNSLLRYTPISSSKELFDFDIWDKIDEVSDSELWELHQVQRDRLVKFTRKSIKAQLEYRNAGVTDISKASAFLDTKALTIGFARRFAVYKRGNLFLSNPERLKAILNNPERPVQIIIAGKAHPADNHGKDIIKNIIDLSRELNVEDKIVFLEDYDLSIARYLVQGVDVWLNNPIRPKEASGTSGMKAALNGALNLSILDGWWDEAYTAQVGFSIGKGENFSDINTANHIESGLFYNVMEKDVVPMFYERDDEDLPRSWIKLMKNSIRYLGRDFNSHRMVQDYVEKFYSPSLDLASRLHDVNCEGVRDLTSWRNDLVKKWDTLKIINVETESDESVLKGTDLKVTAQVKLGEIKADNIILECYHGSLSNDFKIKNGSRSKMKVVSEDKGVTTYVGIIGCLVGGKYGISVRAIPGHDNLANNILPGYLKWYD